MEKYLPILRESPFFRDLTESEVLSVLHCIGAAVVKKEKGTWLLRAGDTTQVMGLILSGSVLVIQEDLWGNRNLLTRCGPGDFFGETYAAKPDTVLNVSVVSETDCEVMLLNVKRLLTTCTAACEHHRRLIRNLVCILADRILAFNEKITLLSKRTTKEKLLSYLTAESVRQGSAAFTIPYNRQELADYLCVERAAMSAELSKLQKQGLLETKRNHFVLHRVV